MSARKIKVTPWQGVQDLEVLSICGNCRFAHMRDEVLICRRYPPQPVVLTTDKGEQSVAMWVAVQLDWWCGEFK